jgi:hypothetical protein
MVPGHPAARFPLHSRIALSTPQITSSRISAQPTTRHRLHGELGWRGTTSGKNSRNFHTLGYEMGNLQKLVFFHTQKVLFHTLENNFIPLKFVSYLENFFHTFIHQFHTFEVCFIP